MRKVEYIKNRLFGDTNNADESGSCTHNSHAKQISVEDFKKLMQVTLKMP